ncbi:helix-turn-helix domain-containing protein [Pseudomonas aeruginosa]|uniref:helix-turn-helix domain-containing protein n=1 Tax=Pseudomonas aeruginosa TaxID=287 RepID=UPI00233F2B74|nr:helix-turn-helix domain-containing protein [Pseudomonas aeruginosa]WCI48156.1 helix-turn-helix domain-containing protein [Pseudomonas aeruginosa]
MLTGIKLRANPTSHQKLILSQWMGCARSIWNAKVEEERYYRTYARKYGSSHLSVKTVTIWTHS